MAYEQRLLESKHVFPICKRFLPLLISGSITVAPRAQLNYKAFFVRAPERPVVAP